MDTKDLSTPPAEFEVSFLLSSIVGDQMRDVLRRLLFQRDQLKKEVADLKEELESVQR